MSAFVGLPLQATSISIRGSMTTCETVGASYGRLALPFFGDGFTVHSPVGRVELGVSSIVCSCDADAQLPARQ